MMQSTGHFKSKSSIIEKGSNMDGYDPINSEMANRKNAGTLKLRQQGSTQNPAKKRKTSNKRNSQLEMTLANYRPREHSPPRSPTEIAKKQVEKEGMVVDSVSYLQQVFIQRKQEDKIQKAHKRNLKSNLKTIDMSPAATRQHLMKQKSLRTEKKADEMPVESKIARVRNPSATIQPIVRKNSSIRNEGPDLNQTLPFSHRINKDAINKESSKLMRVKDSSGERSQDRDRKNNSSNQRQ